eukprot:TRINITY_DN13375_c0_g1_i1.p1 TRINITY_DN13375_c0_g1~~TRINITY_DN13375_c0_g1_i1.p1  ORF type:complete len:513 (-),score=127.46 TRINITY_DN13375_c0_g1_i1:37-1575(-)
MQEQLDPDILSKVLNGDHEALLKMQGTGSKAKNHYSDLEAEIAAMEDDGEHQKNEESKGEEKAVAAKKPAGLKRSDSDKELEEFMNSKEQKDVDAEDMLAKLDQKPHPAPQSQTASVVKHAPVSAPQTDIVSQMISEEDLYHNLSLFLSLALIDPEINLSTPILKMDKLAKKYRDYHASRISELQSFKKRFIGQIENEQLPLEKYTAITAGLKKKHVDLLNKAKEQGKSNHAAKIAARINLLDKEAKEIESNPNYLEKFIDNGKPAEEDELSRRGTISGFFGYGLKNLSKPEKIKLFKTRYAEHKHFAQFLYDNLKVTKRAEIQRLIKIIEEAKEIYQCLEQDKDIDKVDRFLGTRMVEITPEILYGGTLKQRDEELKNLIAKLEKERDFEDQQFEALQIPGKPLSLKMKEHKAKVEELTVNIEKVYPCLKNQWLPVPTYTLTEELKTMTFANTSLELNKMKVIFKRIVGTPVKEFFIKWNIEVSNRVIQEETHRTKAVSYTHLTLPTIYSV